MSRTPFRDTARAIADRMDYIAMSVGCDRVRSHSWWRNMVEYGAWNGPGAGRVGPPDPEAVIGIAKLFATTPEQVNAMIAADWYGVLPDRELSTRVMGLAPLIDMLNLSDYGLLHNLTLRLARPCEAVGDK
ncbi:hypothetical protein AB0L53_34275 [Nonomuraea sp. NPDC052129]|uniref:hypothetical protein n=1 Tax=Nonomuraea sp. NPDC052129 TaxID=3154651 RepID=UPI003435451A